MYPTSVDKRRGAEAGRRFRLEKYSEFADLPSDTSSPTRDLSPTDTRPDTRQEEDVDDQDQPAVQITRRLFVADPFQEPEADPDSEPTRQPEEQDELAYFMKQGPLFKLKEKEKEIAKELSNKNPDYEVVLALRQQCLGLARMHATIYARDQAQMLLLPQQHVKLAKAYADRQYIKQATQHCKRALESIPDHGMGGSTEVRDSLRREVHILLGEMLLQMTPPRPQQALKHFNDAVGDEDSTGDPGIRALISHSHGLLGEQKLSEAIATAQAKTGLEARINALEVRVSGSDPEALDAVEARRQLAACKKELAEENDYLHRLCEEADKEIEYASDEIINIIDAERNKGTAVLDPLMVTLKRRLCELALKAVDIWGLEGNTEQQLGYIGTLEANNNELEGYLDDLKQQQEDSGAEVPRAEDVLIPARLMAKAFKVKAAIFMATGKTHEALELYEKVLDYQRQRFRAGSAKLAVHEAEIFKLKGNVYLAQKHYGMAKSMYDEALRQYSSHLGADCPEAMDLLHRLGELKLYAGMM